MTDIDVLIGEANELAPLPVSAAKLVALLNQEDWRTEEIASVIRMDQALTGRLLGLANSAVSGSQHLISTVGEAAMRMGPGIVLSIALASVVRAEMQQELPGYGLGEGMLWRHSVASALAVEHASRFCRATPPPQAFATALLHDVGKLVLDRHLRLQTSSMKGSSDLKGGTAAGAAQYEFLGVSHDQVGGRIARNWKLPPIMQDGIAFHHDPDRASTEQGRLLGSFVGLADIVAHRIGEICGEQHRLAPQVVQRVGITRVGLEQLCESTAEELQRTMELYS